jgi:D-threonate/D-erythronate kinase
MCSAIVIVADDLTGAADCGIACTMEGLNTVVVFGDVARAAGIVADAIAFDADTRRVSPDVAAAATERAVRELCASGGVRILYKKIDSTLRGNFAVEIAAARRAVIGLLTGSDPGVAPLAIVAPAFPATGRTTRNGRMFLNDAPLEASEVWRTEKIEGVAHIPAMLERAADLRARSVELNIIRAGAQRLAAALDEHAAGKIETIVCDAETDDDLRVIAQAAAGRGQPTIFAGSAGLARHLPRAFNLISASSLKSETAKNVATPTAPLLFVVGSMSQISREQVRALAGEPGIRLVTIAPAALREGARSSDWCQAARLVSGALDGGEDVVLALSLDEGINLAESTLLSGALARFLLPLAPGFGGLFCTGGETARALLDAAGAAGIRLLGEVEPGVPLGTAVGWRDLPVVTKAGAFGTERTLVHCRAALRQLLRGDIPLRVT